MESIYELLRPESAKQEARHKYQSKHHVSVKDEHKSNRNACKTMGPAKVDCKAPNEFLKKHEKEPKLGEKTKFEYGDNDRKKPVVPRRDEKPALMGLKTSKNFITQNAVENIMSVPKVPKKNFADTRSGDKQPLSPSGLEPKHMHKKDYGQVPTYLVKRKDEIHRAQDEYNAYVAEHFRQGAMQQLQLQEQNRILNGLKANWENLHHEYQGLSVVTDTAPKKNRKERMEAEMKQLERDIELIEKHNVIYIAN